jgi:hypothetical protein
VKGAYAFSPGRALLVKAAGQGEALCNPGPGLSEGMLEPLMDVEWSPSCLSLTLKTAGPKQLTPPSLTCCAPFRRKKLRAFVNMIAFPRHFVAEKKANIRARDLLLRLLRNFGYAPQLQGTYDNIVAASSGAEDGPYLLLGAHYDSVPGTPGADDNASAVAVCLECARLLKENDIGSTMIVLFNREEDGLLGSSEFVTHLAGQSTWAIEEAHIFEMVGFCTRAAGSQRMPPGIPGVAAPDVGDFLALLANRKSNA